MNQVQIREVLGNHFSMYQYHSEASRNVWVCSALDCRYWSATFEGAIDHTVEQLAPLLSQDSPLVEWAVFRKSDSEDAQPFDGAILRDKKQAEEYMRINYVAAACEWLEVRRRPAPGRWARPE
jgi:hypothetical protein